MDAAEHTDVTALELLSERHLHERDGDADKEEAAEVGDEEESTTPSVAQVGEAPEITKTDAVADHSQDERGMAEPSRSLSISFVLKEPHAARF